MHTPRLPRLVQVAATPTALRDCVVALEAEWGVRPRLVLACVGGADEHWQAYDPRDGAEEPLPRVYIQVR